MNIEDVSRRVFRILKGNGLTVKPYDELGNEVIDPDDARRFFMNDPNFMVEVDEKQDEDNEGQLYVNIGPKASVEELSSVLDAIKLIADEYLLNYTLRKYGKAIEPKKFSYQAKSSLKKDSKENSMDINESRLGKLHGFRKTSYQKLGEVRIIYRHSKDVNEDSPVTRSLNIRQIVIEHNGEKHTFPNNFVLGARALARHLNEGGHVEDDVSVYIKEMSTRCKRMAEFVRYTNKNKNLIEGNEEAVRLVKENLAQLRYDFKKFIAPTTYKTFKEKFEGRSVPDNKVDDSLRDQFTVKSFDERFESVLPYVSGLLKEKEDFETSINEELTKDTLFRHAPRFSTVLEFETQAAKLAYKLKETASALESESLSTFLGRISEKIASHQALDEFEVKVVREVLGRAKDDAFQINES